jgi:hypothetical protein
MNPLLHSAKSLGKAALRRYYSQNHIRAARAKLEKLEKAYGPLDQSDRARCDAYAVEVLGDRKFAHWLYVYAHVSGSFKEGWIPDNFYDQCVLPHISGPYGELSSLRSLNSVLFDVPEFPDIAAQINGMIVGRDGKPVASRDLVEVLFGVSDRIVFKSDASQSGIGVRVMARTGFDPAQVQSLGSGIFQPFIRQHELFQRLGNSPAVATLRLTTAADNRGEMRVRGAYLRFGQGSADYVLSADEVNAVVDRETGELGVTGYMPSYLRTDRHPQSDEPFAGHAIPNYRECVRVALTCHARVPFIRCIGWDMTVDHLGAVQILEWNGGHTGIKFTEATQGPCFADLGWHRLRG